LYDKTPERQLPGDFATRDLMQVPSVGEMDEIAD
jgi:hypothetical protein